MSDWNAKHLMCRGKAAQGWVCGYYLPKNPNGLESGAVICTFPKKENLGAVCFPVEPETVTACSGLPDKRGRMIFDQDILANEKNETAGIVEYSEEDGMFALIMKDGRMINFSDVESTDYEVVGNGFDNADWLEFV